MKKLNLGCGDKILEGYINVDIVDERASQQPDVKCDIRDLSYFENDYADEVLAVHVIEHFYPWETMELIKEWTRVLKPGGNLVLECPNLIVACAEFLKNPDIAALGGKEGQMSMWPLYGDPSWKDPLMFHKWGYTPNSLGKLLHDVGLKNIRREPAQYKMKDTRDMRIVGTK